MGSIMEQLVIFSFWSNDGYPTPVDGSLIDCFRFTSVFALSGYYYDITKNVCIAVDLVSVVVLW